MRALTEVVAAVRHTVEKLGPLIHESSVRGIVTGEQAHQLNYHCDLLLHGGRFDWEHYFENGAWAVLERKGRQRSKEERQKFEERAHYLKIEKCIESWSKKQPLARFTYVSRSEMASLTQELTAMGLEAVVRARPGHDYAQARRTDLLRRRRLLDLLFGRFDRAEPDRG
jgi:hypothetical protein